MMKALWRMLGQHTLCGAALLAVANLVQAQGLPSLPQPSVMPAVVHDTPKTQPVQLIGGQELAVPQAPGLGVPTSKPATVILPAAPPGSEDKARIERLEKELKDLKDAFKAAQTTPAPVSTAAPQGSGLTPTDVRSLINGYFAEQDAKKSDEKAKADAGGFKVGTKLGMTVSWGGVDPITGKDNGLNGVVFQTENKDFWMRAGFRFQWDNVWYHQSAANVKQIGPMVDGDLYRRVRPNFNGGFWEVGEFNVEIKMENVANGLNGMDDVWVGVKSIPIIGTVRLGHFHLPHGLEADMYSSSKPMTFFEVYSGNNAFFGGERCGSGIWLTNSFLNDRMTYAAVAYRPESTDNGADFANGDYAAIARITGLPIWSDDGRCFLHLGASATWRHARTNPVTGGAPTVAFSTDSELLDRSGGDNRFGNNLNPVPAGFKPSPGNQSAWVSTGAILASSSTIYGLELFYNRGPFSIQAEYDFAFIDGAIVGGKNQGDLGFTGGYIQAGYFLTGESRQYDKRLGRLNSEYISKANTPFWLVKGEDGKFNYGLGAWELAARYSRLDLNGGTGAGGSHLIQGGILDQAELGVNWHLNNNLRIQFMYLHAMRYDLAAGAPGSWMNGFGIRTQLTF